MTKNTISYAQNGSVSHGHKKRIIVHYPRFFCFILTIALLGIWIGNCVSPAQADEPIRVKTLSHYETVTVAFGDTLLGIAEQYSPDENVRGFMYEIMDCNDLDDAKLVAGEKLSVPVYQVRESNAQQMR